MFPLDLDTFFRAYTDAVYLLRDSEDFKDALSAYLTKAKAHGVLYSEVMVDMQNYMSRMKFSEVIQGLREGIELHKESIVCKIIICLNGDNDESEALDMIEQSKKHQDIIVAIGMATSQESLPV
jgi:adenosine deaminase